MHPIERLRFVARANGVDDSLLAVEATAALMSFAHQPPALVAGCRRVLARQPLCGPLWWACARLLTAEDVWAVAQDTIARLEEDPTEAALAYSLDGEDRGELEGGGEAEFTAPPVVMRARAMSSRQAVVEPMRLRGADSWDLEPSPGDDPSDGGAAQSWLVVPVGVHLSDPMWDALQDNLGETGPQVVAVSDFTHFVGPFGLLPIVALDEADCPVAPELFRLVG